MFSARGKYYDERMRFVISSRGTSRIHRASHRYTRQSFFFPFYIRKMIYQRLLCLPSPISLSRVIHRPREIYCAFTRASGIDAQSFPRHGMQRAKTPPARIFQLSSNSPRYAYYRCTLALQIRAGKFNGHFPADRILFRFFAIDRSLARIAVTGICHESSISISPNRFRLQDRRSFRIDHSMCAVNRACKPSALCI